MKWIWVIVLVVIGVLAAYVAIEYFTVSLHALPSYLGPKHGRGHYRKRGLGAAVVAFIAFVVAGYLAYRIVQADKAGPSVTAAEDAPSAPLL